MNARWNQIGAGFVRSGYALLGVGVVALHIWLAIGWQVPPVPNGTKIDEPAPEPHQPDEIREYVQFTHVEFGAAEITTGIQYASDRDRRVIDQWCYIADNIAGGRRVQLTLATKTDAGSADIPIHSQTALADFDLTRASARDLVASHCRFL